MIGQDPLLESPDAETGLFSQFKWKIPFITLKLPSQDGIEGTVQFDNAFFSPFDGSPSSGDRTFVGEVGTAVVLDSFQGKMDDVPGKSAAVPGPCPQLVARVHHEIEVSRFGVMFENNVFHDSGWNGTRSDVLVP